MTAVSAVNPKFYFPNAEGGEVDVYLAGSTTRTNTWQDRDQLTLNTNPVELNARGEALIWVDAALRYKFVVKDADGAAIYTVDNVAGASADIALGDFTQSGAGAQPRTFLAKMREEVTTKDFGAVADGSSHPLSERYASLAAAQVDYSFATSLTQEIDYCAIQAMLNALGVAGGGTGRLSPGSHYIGGATALTITSPHVELVGYGTGSEIYIANWQTSSNPVANGHIVVAKTDGTPIKGVRIAHLKIRGTKDYITDNAWYGVSVPWNTIVFGNDTGETFENCGVEYCFFENTGGSCVGAQAGTNDNAVNASVSKGFYVRNNFVDNTIFSGVDVFSGGIRDADISGNTIRRCSGGGILYSGTSGTIHNNRIEYTANYGIAAAGYSGKGNWTHVTSNKLMRCGFGVQGGTAMSPSMYFGDAAINNFLFIDGNTVTDAYGPGIFVLGSAQDVVIQNNRIHGFGYQGNSGGKTISIPGAGWSGIEAFSSTRVVIRGNTVQALSGASDRSDYGIAAGGGTGADCFADDNTTLGTFLVSPFFFGTVHGGATARAGVRLGRNNNFDVYTMQYAQILNQLNNETLPSFTSGDTTPSIAGSPIWFTANAAPTTITALDGGNVGQEVTIIFQDANTTIADAGQFSLNGAIAPSAVNLTLTLVRGTTGTWFEKARVQS
jgi:hypothetical protein